jgi:hypothetical protein
VNHFKKQFFLVLFMLCAGLFAAGSASAQTWYLSGTTQNPCRTPDGGNTSVGSAGQCLCNSGYTFGTASAGNCKYDGAIIGCWNPGTGKCQECGTGGTIVLGSGACFNNGQYNQGSSVPMGVSCTISMQGTENSSQCIGSGTASGGYSTN